jgi:hypothetical protein
MSSFKEKLEAILLIHAELTRDLVSAELCSWQPESHLQPAFDKAKHDFLEEFDTTGQMADFRWSEP